VLHELHQRLDLALGLGIRGGSVGGGEVVVGGQSHQLSVVHRQPSDEVVGHGLGVVEHNVGGDAAQSFEDSSQPLGQDLEALAGEEADVTPAAEAEHGAQPVAGA
jgi:hypothetical protein